MKRREPGVAAAIRICAVFEEKRRQFEVPVFDREVQRGGTGTRSTPAGPGARPDWLVDAGASLQENSGGVHMTLADREQQGGEAGVQARAEVRSGRD